MPGTCRHRHSRRRLSGRASASSWALAAGPIGDRVGRKPLLLASVAIFGLASLLSAMAGSMGVMSLWRFFTGLGIGGAFSGTVALTGDYTRRPRDARGWVLFAGYCRILRKRLIGSRNRNLTKRRLQFRQCNGGQRSVQAKSAASLTLNRMGQAGKGLSIGRRPFDNSGTGFCMTLRWREPDSNHRSRGTGGRLEGNTGTYGRMARGATRT